MKWTNRGKSEWNGNWLRLVVSNRSVDMMGKFKLIQHTYQYIHMYSNTHTTLDSFHVSHYVNIICHNGFRLHFPTPNKKVSKRNPFLCQLESITVRIWLDLVSFLLFLFRCMLPLKFFFPQLSLSSAVFCFAYIFLFFTFYLRKYQPRFTLVKPKKCQYKKRLTKNNKMKIRMRMEKGFTVDFGHDYFFFLFFFLFFLVAAHFQLQ